VGIRRKGQWGSERSLEQKVALKVHLGNVGDKHLLRGLEKLTFNNMVQDASVVHEHLAYDLFRAMGVPAPRTGYVALYLNGEYRGLYLHIESVDETFLARWFGDAEGNLYEGEYGQDVTLSSYTELSQDERGSHDPDDYSDLLALATLLDEPATEDNMLALEDLVDIDEVTMMWAVEVAIAHWDGYFWYPNNYRIYHDPSTGLLSLLPRGTDQTLDSGGGIESANGALAAWCLEVESCRLRYRLALWEVEDQLAAMDLRDEAVALHAVAAPLYAEDAYKESTDEDSAASLQSTLDFLDARPAELDAALFP